MYRNRQSLAVHVLLSFFLGSVPVLYLIEHGILDPVDFGRPFEMRCNCCLIVVKPKARVFALASGVEGGARFITTCKQLRLRSTIARRLSPWRTKPKAPTIIGDRLRTESVGEPED